MECGCKHLLKNSSGSPADSLHGRIPQWDQGVCDHDSTRPSTACTWMRLRRPSRLNRQGKEEEGASGTQLEPLVSLATWDLSLTRQLAEQPLALHEVWGFPSLNKGSALLPQVGGLACTFPSVLPRLPSAPQGLAPVCTLPCNWCLSWTLGCGAKEGAVTCRTSWVA